MHFEKIENLSRVQASPGEELPFALTVYIDVGRVIAVIDHRNSIKDWDDEGKSYTVRTYAWCEVVLTNGERFYVPGTAADFFEQKMKKELV